jgi:predicted RNA-binding Zn ribbon-like protein
VSHVTAGDGLPRRLGGVLCLDFVNTVDPRHGANRIEYLTSYPMLARWAEQAGAVASGTARDLERAGAARPGPSAAVLDAAIELREHLYLTVRSLLHSQAPPAPSLDALSATVARAHQARLLVPAPLLSWRWRDPQQLDLPVLAVALSAAELVTSEVITRLRECPGADGCGWLFLDTSKSGTRRWCSMKVCGNRAKVRRYRLH